MKSVVPTTIPSPVSKPSPDSSGLVDQRPESEVEHFHDARVEEEQVRGLDIAVDHSLLVRVGEAPANLRHVSDHLMGRQRPAAREDLFQVLPLQILHDDVRAALMLVGIDGPDDVGVVEEPDDLHLAEEPGDRSLVGGRVRPAPP